MAVESKGAHPRILADPLANLPCSVMSVKNVRVCRVIVLQRCLAYVDVAFVEEVEPSVVVPQISNGIARALVNHPSIEERRSKPMLEKSLCPVGDVKRQLTLLSLASLPKYSIIPDAFKKSRMTMNSARKAFPTETESIGTLET